MTDPILKLMEDIQLARTSEPLLLSQPPQQTATAILFGRCLEGIRQLKFRVQELLEANSRYLLRARKSEELLARAVGCMTLVCPEDIKLHEEIKEHLKEPWKLPEHQKSQ
jgi:hypothetical protein